MTWERLARHVPAWAHLATEAEQAGRHGWIDWWRWLEQQRFYKQLVGNDAVIAAVAADHLQRVHRRALRQALRRARAAGG